MLRLEVVKRQDKPMPLRIIIIIRISVIYKTKFLYTKLLLSSWVNRPNDFELEHKFKNGIFQLFVSFTDLKTN